MSKRPHWNFEKWPIGHPCIVCGDPCESVFDFWETPDDDVMNALRAIQAASRQSAT